MSIGERIISLRKEQNISQGQLAQALNVTRQAVSKWENDQAAPDTIKLIQLAEVLDTDVEYLATGRKTYGRRPPVVIKTVETVEKIVEKPVVQVVEKLVEKRVVQYVEQPVVRYVEKPIIKRVERVKYVRNPVEFAIAAVIAFVLGIIFGRIIF
ncbi:MAG: helix-turn-helix domain-containing protein [Oscillospiraceae bacterium]|nr:helix-turn-helix domain-containing protein [Oscillospiraceae bacterium]